MAMTNMLEAKIEQSIDDGLVDAKEINDIADLTKDKQTESTFINECKDRLKNNAELKNQLMQYIKILENFDNGEHLG
jgi:predicted transcriptional regulator